MRRKDVQISQTIERAAVSIKFPFTEKTELSGALTYDVFWFDTMAYAHFGAFVTWATFGNTEVLNVCVLYYN